MKFDMTMRVVYQVTITDLELVPSTDACWEGLIRDSSLDNPNSILDEEEFEENWLTEVTRNAIDVLPMYDKLENVHFYLGRWACEAGDNKPVAILDSETINYGKDVTYNGWRVMVSSHEVTWGLD